MISDKNQNKNGKNPDKKPPKNDPYGCDEPDKLNIQGTLDMQTASATDCTGLIPALPASDSELESYAQVYHYPANIFQD